MSLFDRIASFWRSVPQPEGEDLAAVDQVFKYLIGLVRDPEKMVKYVEEVRAARFAPSDVREQRLIRVYFDLERSITSSIPAPLEKYAIPERLRESVRTDVGITGLPKNLQLVFLSESEQISGIYLSAVKSLYEYVGTYGGSERVAEIVGDALRRINGISLPAKGTARNIVPRGTERESPDLAIFTQRIQVLPHTKSLEALRFLYEGLFDEIRKSFGEVKATDIVRRDYEFFKTTYEAAFTARFLDILPEGVLEIERLAFLSREELERKIKERTKELNELNTQLEEKVNDRTKELTAANERLRELDKVKTEFISVAAHQLRTPLSAVKWTLSLLIDGSAKNLTVEQRALLLKGYESNERTINLINKMLVVTRIESGKMEYDVGLIHIEDLIDAVLLDFAGIMEVRRVAVSFKKLKKPLPYIRVDAEKIRAVIQNLIENALYYTKENGTVEISAACADGFITVSVKDDGIGIPARQQMGIFNKFFRADNAAKARTDGSGLGLFVVKSIIDKHGGMVGFKSTENVGSTFYFTLPVASETDKVVQ